MDAVKVAVLFSLYPQQIKRPPQNSSNAKPALRPAAQGLMVTKASDVMEGTFLPPPLVVWPGIWSPSQTHRRGQEKALMKKSHVRNFFKRM